MERKKRTTITVSSETQLQLNELKGSYSLDEYLKGVVYYLKLYRIDVMRRDIAPNQDVHNHYNDIMKRLEDVIKIIKSFEKGMKGILLPDAISKSETASSVTGRDIKKMQDVIDKLRADLASKEEDPSRDKLMSIYSMTMDFLEQNADGDGALLVGKTRTNQFRDSLKEVFNG